MRTSKHERIIREKLGVFQRELETSLEFVQVHQRNADSLQAQIDTLEGLLDRADADKTRGDDD